MDRNTLAQLREQRAERHAAMQAMLSESEGRLDAERSEQYDRIEAEYDSLDADIKRGERQLNRDLSSDGRALFDAEDHEREEARRGETRAERFDAVLRSVESTQRTSGAEAAMRELIGTEEYREAFFMALRADGRSNGSDSRATLPEEYRAALNLGVAAEGGITAPVEFMRRLFEDPEEFGVMRQIAYVFSTSHGRDLQWAELVSKGQAGWTNAEVPADPDAFKSEPTFGGPRTIGAHPAQREIATSRDLLQDSVFDIEALIKRVASESFALLENPAFATGDGNGKPDGLFPNIPAANLHTLAAAALGAEDITTDDLIDVQHELPRPYRRKASWLFNDDTLRAIRKLKDGNGDLIWQPGLKEGTPDRILGKPYTVDDDAPASGASARPIAYGDYTGYWIRDVLDLRVTPLPETYARTRQMGWLFDKRVDGTLMEPNKVAGLAHPAA